MRAVPQPPGEAAQSRMQEVLARTMNPIDGDHILALSPQAGPLPSFYSAEFLDLSCQVLCEISRNRLSH